MIYLSIYGKLSLFVMPQLSQPLQPNKLKSLKVAKTKDDFIVNGVEADGKSELDIQLKV